MELIHDNTTILGRDVVSVVHVSVEMVVVVVVVGFFHVVVDIYRWIMVVIYHILRKFRLEYWT